MNKHGIFVFIVFIQRDPYLARNVPDWPRYPLPGKKKGGSSALTEETARFPTTHSKTVKPW
tara:strand:+ start:29761 stop:29943 length:183 start_codon:yes stop_codon:yes gene_type:complete